MELLYVLVIVSLSKSLVPELPCHCLNRRLPTVMSSPDEHGTRQLGMITVVDPCFVLTSRRLRIDALP